MAHKNREYKTPLIHHSDRGLQYCSDAYQKSLNSKAITPSMTESYDPYANAIIERVNGISKQELAFEGYHWFDLRRFNQKTITHKAGEITAELNANDPRYTIAFPRSARLENPKFELKFRIGYNKKWKFV